MYDGYTIGFSIIFFLVFAFIFLFTIATFVFWIWMLIDCLKRPDENFSNPGPNTKLTWALIIIFTHFLGAVLYYFLVKRTSKSEVQGS